MFKGILPALIIGASFFGFFMLVLPEYDQIKAAQQEIEARRQILKERQDALKHVLSLDRQTRERQADIDRINLLIPPRNQSDQVVSSLNQITSQAGVRMTGLTISSRAQREAAHNILNVNVELFGQYASFLNFLQLIEQNIRIYDVKNISIGQAESIGQGTLSFNVRMDAYFLE